MRLFLLLFLIAASAFASDPYPKNPNIKVEHYTFSLALSDSSDVIKGKTVVSIRFLKPAASFDLNLIGKKPDGKGMDVKDVTMSGKPVTWKYQNDLISIQTKDIKAGDSADFTITYTGIPADGLIISKNKFGDRTFFGDNWPDRGRYWLPTIDHPSYKATVDFIVNAPEHYEVVATGKLLEESYMGNNRKLTHYKESVPVPVKVMTIGVARFAVKLLDEVGGVPVTSWVYPQDRVNGFIDMDIAPTILDVLQSYIGLYPFEKLAHVQSKTRFGGLENAGNIFYFENFVTGKREREELIAHETAHQWFGDSASEDDWHHVWLSEGFATYFTAVYMEHRYGPDNLITTMTNKRTTILEFAKKNSAPIVDTTIVDINRVLSTNTYQKASWVLHMLRKKVGDEVFHKGIRAYYEKYKFSNALTADFRKVMEETSGQDLKPFFDRWLYIGGHPKINGSWKYDAKAKQLVVAIELTDVGKLAMPLEIGLKDISGKIKIETVTLQPGKNTLKLAAESKPQSVELDPGAWLLFEGGLKAAK